MPLNSALFFVCNLYIYRLPLKLACSSGQRQLPIKQKVTSKYPPPKTYWEGDSWKHSVQPTPKYLEKIISRY